ncbi:MAG: YdjY domain-containing protein [Planctomycetota bacterium]
MQVYLRGFLRPSTAVHAAVWFAAATLAAGCGKPIAEETATAEGESAAEASDADGPDVTTEPSVDTPPAAAAEEPAPVVESDSTPKLPKPLPAPKRATPLSPDHDIWIDVDNGELIIDGNVSLRQGVLEMFACTRNTKEHESIVSANTLAYTAHAALLKLKAKVGSPVSFDPEYAPPTGTEIEITLEWRDEAGEMQTARAQEWVRNYQTGKAMTEPWVFAGSWLAEDEESGEKAYMAEGGDFICVSNFTTAMLDVPIKSSKEQAEGLLFEAFTERIPPLGAPVRMRLKPKLEGE